MVDCFVKQVKVAANYRNSMGNCLALRFSKLPEPALFSDEVARIAGLRFGLFPIMFRFLKLPSSRSRSYSARRCAWRAARPKAERSPRAKRQPLQSDDRRGVHRSARPPNDDTARATTLGRCSVASVWQVIVYGAHPMRRRASIVPVLRASETRWSVYDRRDAGCRARRVCHF